MKHPHAFRAPAIPAMRRTAGAVIVALSLTSCVTATKRIPDPACEHCYRTESGIPYKTWEAYDP